MHVIKRQFQRLVEMLILRSLQPHDIKATRAFRLQVYKKLSQYAFHNDPAQVKERLYRFNYVSIRQAFDCVDMLTPCQDALVQLDKDERIEKLEVTYQNVWEGYQQILARVQ